MTTTEHLDKIVAKCRDNLALAEKRTQGKIHDLKTDPEAFDAVARKEKTFEIRKDDRGFKVGDTLLLRRTRYTGEQMHFGDPLDYTGEQELRIVTHILRGPLYGLADGWVIMSIAAWPEELL